jgi:hypothetical protein
MRNELDKVRTMLEESFTRSHQQALLNGSIGEAGSISETLVGSSKSPKPGESVTEYDKPGELTIYSTPSRITLKKPKALPTLSTVLDSDISIFVPVSALAATNRDNESTLLTHCQRITVSDLWVTALPGLSELPKMEGSSAE